MTSLSDIQTGTPAHKWDDNDTIGPAPVLECRETQQTDIKTGDPRNWPDGRPMMQWVFTLQAHAPTSDDDGRRTIYLKGGKFEVASGKGQSMLDAVVGAYRAAGISEFEGALLTVKRTGLGVKKPGMSAPSLYSAKAEPGKTPVPAAAIDPDDPF